MIIVLNIDSCKKEITWWRWGKFDRTTIFLMLMVILLSSLSLFFWTHLIKQNLNEYLKFIPDFSLVLIILYGIVFPFFNSIFEEFLARAV
jgi:membrane protease YdiL (CAAX protease family)